jgi:segregation and condensation protein B
MEEVEQAPEGAVEEAAELAEVMDTQTFESLPEASVPEADATEASLKAIVEAAVYVADEPLTAAQIAAAFEQPLDRVQAVLDRLVEEYAAPDRGLAVREIAGGYKMSTKPEHHEAMRRFVKRLQPPLKLSMAALETLAVIAYKQPITAPEIMEIRGVQGAGVLKTLLDRKLIATAGRKNVLGKPITYKTTREFLVQFGLNSLSELPTLKEFEELGRLALSDSEETPQAESEPVQQTEAVPEAAAQQSDE